jgi:DNA-binding helix-hairpin-helix protein with protein kinase domain
MSKQPLIDRTGSPVILGSELGKGGEGAVFNIHGNPGAVAKIYFKPPDQAKAYKIIAMVEASKERLLKLAAWPLNSIHNRMGDLVGFSMQKLQGYRPLFELYSPKLRLREFPQADWRFLIHAATNTARAFLVIHEAGHVIGDVNHGNLLVGNDATVKFIDTDSFQISVNGQNWLCDVGVATHQPPEMQGHSSYKGIIRTPNQDNFGLAVLIFQLLCLARHPFSGRFSGQGEMPLEKAIAECRFAYTRDNRLTQMAPPPASLPMSALPPQIWALFERAFGREGSRDGMRPTPKEWIAALEGLAASLKTCQSNQGHYYLNSIAVCPWCDIEVKSSSTLFPVIIRFTNGNQSFQVLWQQVLAIKNPGPAPSLSDLTAISYSPSKEAQEIGKKVKRFEKRIFAILGTVLVVTLGIGFYSGYSPWQLVLIGIGIWGLIHCKKAKAKLVVGIEQHLKVVENQWKELSSNWASWATEAGFTKVRRPLDELKQKYDALQHERQCKLQKLWDTRHQQQLLSHLDRYRIDSANIEGIGPGRSATLQSYAIETAADIDDWRIEGISGFGPKLRGKLCDWRDQCVRTFVFDSSRGVSDVELQAVDRDIIIKRRKLEQELAVGVAQLARTSDQILERRKHLYSQASSILNTYSQAFANASAVGLNP